MNASVRHSLRPWITKSPRARGRGVSLIEALIALLIMAVGMLSLVGLITGARHSTELSRQRTEALSLARAELAQLRTFVALTRGATTPATARVYADITDQAQPTAAPLPDTNTAYNLQRTVLPLSTAGQGRLVRVTVRWQDRAGTPQKVQLDTVIAEVDPSFSAGLAVAPAAAP